MLKSIFSVGIVAVAFLQNVQAVELVNKDGTELSETCIIAIESGNVARNHKNSNIRCNGMSVSTFTKKYAKVKEQNKAFAFNNVDNTPESELCIAAATSNEAFAEVAARVAINTNKVKCNGVALNKFAKRFNNQFKS